MPTKCLTPAVADWLPFIGALSPSQLDVLVARLALSKREGANSMVKSELVLRICAQNPHLYQRDVDQIVEAIFEAIVASMMHSGRVELRGFGTFTVRIRESHIGRNPRTGVKVAVSKKVMPYFKPSREMYRRLNPDNRRQGSDAGQSNAGDTKVPPNAG